MMKKYKFRLVGIIGLFGLCSFSNAENFNITSNSEVYLPTYVRTITDLGYNDFTCYICRTNYCNTVAIYDSGDNKITDGMTRYTQIVCGEGLKYTNWEGSTNYLYVFTGFDLGGSCPECSTCPEVDTGSILSGSCDTNYCVENDLCPVPSNFSTLFINDIEHQSAPVINVTIPREYSRDSSVDSGQFDLVISGYNVDYEYIDGIVRTQNAKPSQTDFNNIVSGLIPLLIPGLVIILFIRFVFKFIKKIL